MVGCEHHAGDTPQGDDLRPRQRSLTASQRAWSRGTRWWLPWLGVVVLITLGGLLPRLDHNLAAVRRQMRAQRCREQMLALASGEVQHYLDHQSFTTEQRALTRYVPYAEHARCPGCEAAYVLEVFKDRARIGCPCKGVKHGWVDQPVPAQPDSHASAEIRSP